MDNKDYALALALKKQEFIRQIIDETSLDMLDSWYDMYEEASFGHWFRQGEIEGL